MTSRITAADRASAGRAAGCRRGGDRLVEIEIGLDPARDVAAARPPCARGSRRAASSRPARRSARGARSAAPACGAARPPRSGRSCCRAPRSGRSGRAGRHRAPATRATLPCWIWTTPMAASWRMASRAIGLLTPKEVAIRASDGKASPGFSRPSWIACVMPRDQRVAEPDRHDLGRAERVAVDLGARVRASFIAVSTLTIDRCRAGLQLTNLSDRLSSVASAGSAPSCRRHGPRIGRSNRRTRCAPCCAKAQRTSQGDYPGDRDRGRRGHDAATASSALARGWPGAARAAMRA